MAKGKKGAGANNQPSKKNKEKQKEKSVEDKTFGLKNKNKSKQVQRYVEQVEKQVKGGPGRAEKAKEEEKKKKAQAKKQQEDMNALFAAAITQPKVPPGVDPKSMLCAFFKQGMCTKGNRCKFSHDPNVERRSAKIDLYTDARQKEKEADNMETWDQNKLEEVIDEKHGKKNANQTDIVCKYFLDAIEKQQYGWFWTCPNGGSQCKYRHALPPGYVFKTRAERELERESAKVDEVSIEEVIEQQRAKLGPTGGTPVNSETLAKWKEEKRQRKDKEAEQKRKEEAKKSGGRSIMSGRALFSFDPTLFRDDANAVDEENLSDDEVEDAANVMDKSLYVGEDLEGVRE